MKQTLHGGDYSMLTSGGYKCRTASDGLEALAVLNSGEEFNLLVANLRTPNLDGIGFLTHVKEQFPDMPFVIESAVHDISVARTAIQNGADDYLLKPVERVKLLIVVRRALRHRNPKLENPFDIACTYCHASKRQIDAWRVKYGPVHWFISSAAKGLTKT
jgi:DNA-binding NtrC family response regulator